MSVDSDKIANLVKNMEQGKRKAVVSGADILSDESFDEVYANLSKEEVFPNLMESEKTKIIKLVKEELHIDEILSEVQYCDFESLVCKKKGHLIEYLSKH